MIDPRLVAQTADLVDQHPDAVVEDEPAGIVDAVIAEMDRRKANKAQDLGQQENTPDPYGEFETQKRANTAKNPLGFMSPSKPIGAAAQGALQGGSLMFVDELAGVGNAIKDAAIDPASVAQPGGLVDSYKAGRDPVREDFKTAQADQPIASTVGMLAGGAATPLPKLSGGAFARGAKVGTVMGAGANESMDQLPVDMAEYGLVGGGMGVAGEKIAGGVKAGAAKLYDKADELLSAALEIPIGSKKWLELKASGFLDDVLASVRNKAEFPYSAGKTRANIEEPAIAKNMAGTVVNPELEVPALSGPPTLDAAYNASYMRPQTRPAPNQMPFPDRVASQQLGGIVDKSGGGLMPKTGLQAMTPQGGIMSAVMSRGEMLGGVGFSRIADKMTDLMAKSDMSKGMSQMATGKLAQLIKAVLESADPDLEDYLAQEISPEYKALRMAAANEANKEASK